MTKYEGNSTPGAPVVDRASRANNDSDFAPRLEGYRIDRVEPNSAYKLWLAGRYIGSYTDYTPPRTIGNVWYLDATLEVGMEQALGMTKGSLGGLKLIVSGTNLTDKLPPYSTYFRGYDVFNYDLVGRTIFARLKFRYENQDRETDRVPPRADLHCGLVSVCSRARSPRSTRPSMATQRGRSSDGFSNRVITAFAQTSDGYLWLGTSRGLQRFDGVRNVPWQPPAGTSFRTTIYEHSLQRATGRSGSGPQRTRKLERRQIDDVLAAGRQVDQRASSRPRRNGVGHRD